MLIIQALLAFIVIISIIVFIHEFGHFFVARLCKVKVEIFSIGFGKELIGFTDKKGTRWKISILPFGGYVKMYGDKNAASAPDFEMAKTMNEKEKNQSFIFKEAYQKALIVAAGPIANFLLAIFILTTLFKINGYNQLLPIIDQVLPNSAAFEAGLKKDDKILEINQQKISDFNEVRQIIMDNKTQELSIKIERKNKIINFNLAPKYQISKDFFGEEVRSVIIGVTASQIHHSEISLFQSFTKSIFEVYRVSLAIFKTLGELIIGKHSVKELSGPIKIAKYSGKTFAMGLEVVAWFMAMISINLGVMNLLPIPMLDGGHLFFYIYEMIFGKAIKQQTQETALRFGLSLLLALMVITTFNDLNSLLK